MLEIDDEEDFEDELRKFFSQSLSKIERDTQKEISKCYQVFVKIVFFLQLAQIVISS